MVIFVKGYTEVCHLCCKNRYVEMEGVSCRIEKKDWIEAPGGNWNSDCYFVFGKSGMEYGFAIDVRGMIWYNADMIKREIEAKFNKYIKERKVVLVTGARQVGKSTFVKSMADSEREYVTLDDLALRALAQDDPKLFLMNYPGEVIFDEIQYAPDLFSYIKIEADNSRKKGRFWLTGSQRFELMQNVSESLAGRVGILEMSSLSLAEKEGFSSRLFLPEKPKFTRTFSTKEIFHHIFIGGMPEYVVDKLDRKMFFDDYIRTYLERDVRRLLNVGDLKSFRKFLISVAARNGEVVNYHSIAEDADINEKTAKKWLSVLEASDLIYLLQPYSNNLLTRTTEAPKIIFLDSGLCAYLCGWNSEEALENSSVSGHYLEAFVISELIKNQRNNAGEDKCEIYFYRDKDQREIDLIIKKDGVIHPFEIKKTAKPDKLMIDNFRLIEGKNFEVGNGGLLCFYPEVLPLTEKYKAYPISVVF